MSSFPTQARAVIVGGGIIGCSVAYHLARLGWTDTVLLERAKLTSGSTFHAAGLVGQLRSNANVTRMLTDSVALYESLEAITGLATGWKRSGCLRLACTAERMTEYQRQVTTARSFGLDMDVLTPAEAKALWPVMDADDLVGAVFTPSDGQANPSDITQALARGARMAGATIIEDCAVTGVTLAGGRVTGVETDQGTIACEVVVNCAGQWAREFGALAGVNVPLVSVQHQYLITEPIAGLPRDLPTLRDPDRLTYFKEEVGGLVMGGYEPNPIPWAVDGIPPGFHFTLLDSDWDHFEPMMAQALARVPALETAGIKDLVNGPESFTPDGNFILGAAPGLAGYYVGAGFNAFGIASAGGAGKALAEWIDGGEAPMDLWPVDIRRFGPHHADVAWVRTRTLELYGKHYGVAWPAEEHDSGRPVFRSPLYDRLRARGACFGEKMGWERPNWFAIDGAEARDIPTFGRANWFDAVAAEHKATRQRVALFDQSSFAKYLVTGPGAEGALDWICAGDVTKAPGRLTYTQMLNGRGGIECDLTVARLAADRFYIVTGTGSRTHDFHWIRDHLRGEAAITDVTRDFGTLALMGPASRDLLTALGVAALDNEHFPFGACRSVTLAGVDLWALRVTYVGELGWELHVPIDGLGAVYDALAAAGEAFGLVDAGYRAIESLRLEKGYRAWAADIGPDHTPIEAGLAWAVKFKSGRPFMGRDALEGQRARGVAKRLGCFVVEDPAVVLLGRETILKDGKPVGWLTSGGWGHTVGLNIGYGYVRDPAGVTPADLAAGSYALEVATRRVPCRFQAGPLYDPTAGRVKA
ncbi:MAG: FAD-dependent oxidoreductase [Rhodobacterales bacterium]|nr:FAD-dependent oxidoreductase [Rhodobacterales bacterium]